MKIIYKQGNLLECEEKIIVHGCNAQGVMGAGVAKAIKENYPLAWEAYRGHYYLRHRIGTRFKLGSIIWANCGNKLIGNAITQEYYGGGKKQYCSYEAIIKCMIRINHFLDAPLRKGQYEKIVAMPKIGAGLAGGDWNIIEKIIEDELTDVQPVVYYL